MLEKLASLGYCTQKIDMPYPDSDISEVRVLIHPEDKTKLGAVVGYAKEILGIIKEHRTRVNKEIWERTHNPNANYISFVEAAEQIPHQTSESLRGYDSPLLITLQEDEIGKSKTIVIGLNWEDVRRLERLTGQQVPLERTLALTIIDPKFIPEENLQPAISS